MRLWWVHRSDCLDQTHKDVALSAVEQNGMALQLVPTDIANYKDVALSAVAQNCIAFTFIPKDLKYVSRASMMVI